jgi:Undecaprenyl-phosphate glucose phosphotransferase
MNFVNRDLTVNVTSEVASGSLVPWLNAERKWPLRYEAIELLAICTDIVTILLASILSALIYWIDSGLTATNLGKALGSAIIVSALFVSLVRTNGTYRPTELLVLRHQIRAVCLAWIFVFLVVTAAVGALNIGHELPRGAGVIFALFGLVMLIAQRTAIKTLLVRAISGRRFAGGNVVLISDQLPSKNGGLAETLNKLGFSVSARFELPPPGSVYRKRLSARVVEHVRGSDIEGVMVEADPNRWAELRALVADLRVLPFPIVFVPVGAVAEMLRRPTRDLGSAVCIELQRRPLTVAERASKRLLDLVGAGLALITLSPLLAAVAVAIILDSRGPVFFRQQRCGFNGCSFAVYKFRTMFVLEDGPSIIQASSVDSRVTRVGKWLRRTSIDELPQLFNVLNGSMSLVGPRPHAVAHDSQFNKVARNYAFRRRVKPGLTGWAQIHGCRGPTPTAASIERRVEYDLWYIDNWSFGLDFAILLQTPIEVLRGRNAY